MTKETQAQRVYEKIDSLETGRTTFSLDVSGFLYTSVIFESLVSTDSVKIYNVTDSVSKYLNGDTVACYLRNLSTYAEYSSGLVNGLTADLEIQPLNPNIKKLYIKFLNPASLTIYFRVRGITY